MKSSLKLSTVILCCMCLINNCPVKAQEGMGNGMDAKILSKIPDEMQRFVSELPSFDTGFRKYLNENFPLLSNLHYHYTNVPVEFKQKIIGSIFPGKLIYEENKYRTTEMNRVILSALQR